MELGTMLKLLIKYKKFKQKDFCKLIPISNNGLSMIISNHSFPEPKNLNKISELLDIPKHIIFFLCVLDEPKPENTKEIWNLMLPMYKSFLLKIHNTEEKQYNELLDKFFAPYES